MRGLTRASINLWKDVFSERMDCRVKPGNDESKLPRYMRRSREPAAVLPRPAVGVTPRSGLAVRCRVAGSGMNDRKIAHHPNLDVMRFKIFDRHRHRSLLEKTGAVDQRPVGV